jgi:hypothetical protein
VVLTVHLRQYVEIKCQLHATDEFLLQILLLAQHVSGTIMPIISCSRVLHKWLLSVVFGAWFSSCRYGVELRVVCPVRGLLLYSATRKPDTQPCNYTLYRQLENQAPNTTDSKHLYNTLELLMMGIMVPETCWASNKICDKNSSVVSSWHFISTYAWYIRVDCMLQLARKCCATWLFMVCLFWDVWDLNI